MKGILGGNSVFILTINDCPGMRVVRAIGPVYGTGVRSRNIVGNLLGGIRAVLPAMLCRIFKGLVNNTRSTFLRALYRLFSQKRGEALQISSDFCQVAFIHSLSDGKSPLRIETK